MGISYETKFAKLDWFHFNCLFVQEMTAPKVISTYTLDTTAISRKVARTTGSRTSWIPNKWDVRSIFLAKQLDDPDSITSSYDIYVALSVTYTQTQPCLDELLITRIDWIEIGCESISTFAIKHYLSYYTYTILSSNWVPLKSNRTPFMLNWHSSQKNLIDLKSKWTSSKMAPSARKTSRFFIRKKYFYL